MIFLAIIALLLLLLFYFKKNLLLPKYKKLWKKFKELPDWVQKLIFTFLLSALCFFFSKNSRIDSFFSNIKRSGSIFLSSVHPSRINEASPKSEGGVAEESKYYKGGQKVSPEHDPFEGQLAHAHTLKNENLSLSPKIKYALKKGTRDGIITGTSFGAWTTLHEVTKKSPKKVASARGGAMGLFTTLATTTASTGNILFIDVEKPTGNAGLNDFKKEEKKE